LPPVARPHQRRPAAIMMGTLDGQARRVLDFSAWFAGQRRTTAVIARLDRTIQ
jgi:hypothetical protein